MHEPSQKTSTRTDNSLAPSLSEKARREYNTALAERSIPLGEITVSTSRSTGKGGQHVNKTDSKITLHWRFIESSVLSAEEKHRIAAAASLRNYRTDEGLLVIHEQSERSQHINKERAMQKLHRLVSEALYLPKPRKRTKIPRRAKERRLKLKLQQQEKKQRRKKQMPV